MATMQQVREAIGTTINDGIDALEDSNARRLTAYPRVVGSPILPALIVQPLNYEIAAMRRGLYTIVMRIIVVVSAQAYDDSQYELDQYLEPSGDRSFAGLLWNNPAAAPRTLGLPDTSVGSPNLVAYGGQWDSVGIDHIGAELNVAVHTRADSGEDT